MKTDALQSKLYPPRAKQIQQQRRRFQVLEGMWAGRTTKEIASDLGISTKTVEYHRVLLYQALGVNDPVSACRRGLALGLIRLPRREKDSCS